MNRFVYLIPAALLIAAFLVPAQAQQVDRIGLGVKNAWQALDAAKQSQSYAIDSLRDNLQALMDDRVDDKRTIAQQAETITQMRAKCGAPCQDQPAPQAQVQPPGGTANAPPPAEAKAPGN